MTSPHTQAQSFQDQCVWTLTSFLTNWKSYDNPKSYIVPSVFYFMYPEVTDRELEQRQHQPFDAFVKHRISDQAEFVVHLALTKLIQENYQAPFVALHPLDMCKVQHILPLLFPDAQPERKGLKAKLRATLERQLSLTLPNMDDSKRTILLDRFSDALPWIIGAPASQLGKHFQVT